MCNLYTFGGVWGGQILTENQSISGVFFFASPKCNTSPLHRVDQVVDCGLWNVGPLLFNGCAKLLDIGIKYYYLFICYLKKYRSTLLFHKDMPNIWIFLMHSWFRQDHYRLTSVFGLSSLFSLNV